MSQSRESNNPQPDDSVKSGADDAFVDPIDALNERIKNVELGMAALHDEKFDGNVYRKALRASITEDVFGRLRDIFWIVSTVGGLGLFLATGQAINKAVSDEFTKRQRSIEVLSEQNFRQELVSRLLMAQQRDWDATALDPISERERGVIKSCMVAPQRDVERYLAFEYARARKDVALVPTLITVTEDEGATLADRIAAMDALVAMPYESVGRHVITVSGELQHAPEELRLRLGRALSLATAGDKQLGEFMDRALARVDRTSSAALVFYVLNQPRGGHLPISISTGLRKAQPNLAMWLEAMASESPWTEQEADSISEGLDALYPNPLLELLRGANTEEVTRLFGESVSVPDRDTSLSMAQIEALAQALALRGLRDGRLEVARTLWQRDGRLDERVWFEYGRGLFRDLAGVPISPSSEKRASQAEEEQAAIVNDIEHYHWDRSQFIRQDEGTVAIAELRNGRLDAFTSLMQSGYFDEGQWRSEVRPLFPGWRHIGGDVAVQYEQDELAAWVRANEGKLHFNQKQQVWQVAYQPEITRPHTEK